MYECGERRRGNDRRSQDLPPPGRDRRRVDRRARPRRAAGVLAAAALGVLFAFGTDLTVEHFGRLVDPSAPGTVAPEDSQSPLQDTAALRNVLTLREEAEALTATEVMLDERASERWIPLIPALEARRIDGSTPARVRRELIALLAHLESVGLRSRTPITGRETNKSANRAAAIPPINASVSN